MAAKGPLWGSPIKGLSKASMHGTHTGATEVFTDPKAPYGTIWNSGGGVLHGFSARIFLVFGPWDPFWVPGAQIWARAQNRDPILGLGPK